MTFHSTEQEPTREVLAEMTMHNHPVISLETTPDVLTDKKTVRRLLAVQLAIQLVRPSIPTAENFMEYAKKIDDFLEGGFWR